MAMGTILPYQPTKSITESIKKEGGRGCGICSKDIVGEDARYYQAMHYHEVWGWPRHQPGAAGAIGGGEGLVRLHFIQHEFGG